MLSHDTYIGYYEMNTRMCVILVESYKNSKGDSWVTHEQEIRVRVGQDNKNKVTHTQLGFEVDIVYLSRKYQRIIFFCFRGWNFRAMLHTLYNFTEPPQPTNKEHIEHICQRRTAYNIYKINGREG